MVLWSVCCIHQVKREQPTLSRCQTVNILEPELWSIYIHPLSRWIIHDYHHYRQASISRRRFFFSHPPKLLSCSLTVGFCFAVSGRFSGCFNLSSQREPPEEPPAPSSHLRFGWSGQQQQGRARVCRRRAAFRTIRTRNSFTRPKEAALSKTRQLKIPAVFWENSDF